MYDRNLGKWWRELIFKQQTRLPDSSHQSAINHPRVTVDSKT